MKRTAVITLLAFVIVTAYPPSIASSSQYTIVRVCVLKDVKETTLTVEGSYKIYALSTNELLQDGNDLRKAKVLTTSSGLSIGSEKFPVYGVKIVPGRNTVVSIGKRSFRGYLDIVRTREKKILVINHIDLEDYLKGVLYHEVSHWWPMETLKAQAIAARTYALYQKKEREGKEYDLTNDIYSQVYGGRISERWKTNKAIKLTQGMVLTFKGEIFPAYYHATCGGHTEDASNLWNIDLPPLKGVRSDFCGYSPHYHWSYKTTARDVEEKLDRSGYPVKNLREIKLLGKNSSGRVKELLCIGDSDVTVPAKDFRMIIDPNLIRSTDFEVTAKGKNLLFRGHGWGHGVGMCQWGAFFLGLKRYRAKEILQHYYPGVKIRRL